MKRRRPNLEPVEMLLSLGLVLGLLIWCYAVSNMVITLEPNKIFLIIASVVIFFIVMVHPEFGFGLLVFITPIYNPYIREVRISGALANNLLFIMAMLAFGAKKLLTKDRKLVHTSIDLPIFSLIAWMIIIQFKTVNFLMMAKKFFGLLLFMLPILATINVMNRKSLFIRLLDLISISTIIGSLYGIYTGVFEPFGGTVHRAYGAFVNPNGLGNYLLITIPIVLTYLVSMPSSTKRIIYAMGFVIMLVAMMATKSRGAWVGLGAAFFLLAMFHRQRLVFLVIICLLTIPMISVPQLSEKVVSIINFQHDSFMARYILWNEALKTIAENPITGVGMGNWVRSPVPYNAKDFDNAFNMFLTAGAEMGLIGSLFLAWIIFAAFFKGMSVTLRFRDQFWRSVSMGLTASIFGNIVHGMVEDPVYMIFSNWMIGTVIGLVFAIENVFLNGVDTDADLEGTEGKGQAAGPPEPPPPRFPRPIRPLRNRGNL